MDVYGQGSNYKQRVFLIYDGIHYDPLALTFEDNLPEYMDVTVFNPDDTFAVAKAIEVAEIAHSVMKNFCRI
jgi:ubiquitin thioesterase OTU1